MRKYIRLAAVAMLALAVTSCEKDLETYSNADCYLNFKYLNNDGYIYDAEDVTDDMRVFNYSFATKPSETTEDIVWFDATTSGFLSDQPRQFMLERLGAAASSGLGRRLASGAFSGLRRRLGAAAPSEPGRCFGAA